MFSPVEAEFHHAVYGTFTVKAPRGMKWKKDKEGIFLCRNRDGTDWHHEVSTMSELSTQPARVLLARATSVMDQAVQLRKRQEAKEEKAELAFQYGHLAKTLPWLIVKPVHAYMAGYCIRGTRAFCIGTLKGAEELSVKLLCRLMKGKSDFARRRVLNVIQKAVQHMLSTDPNRDEKEALERAH